MKVRDIAELLGGRLHGDGEIEIDSCAEISVAGNRQIAFTSSSEHSIDTKASSVIVPPELHGSYTSTIAVADPKLGFAKAAALLHPPKRRETGIHLSAIVAQSARIGQNVSIGPGACIGDRTSIGDGTQIGPGSAVGDDVRIGENCFVHANVCIEDRCQLGDNVVLHAGVVLGSDGFGYVRDGAAGYVKFPQIGTVVIDDNVEIGANTCVDRGALGPTRIGDGTKIDNLVQVGHNVQIGKRCVIAAQTGISGSVVIEDDCVIGGQVGFGDHVRVRSGAIIGSQAGVLPGKIVRPGVWWGTPIQPLEEYKRQNAQLKSIERLKSEVKELSKRLAKLLGEPGASS